MNTPDRVSAKPSMEEVILFDDPQALRERIIRDLHLKTPRFYPLSVAYVWPTIYCPVGCDHCMFSTPDLSNMDPKNRLSSESVDAFIALSHESQLDTLVLSGGGEPMLEMAIVLEILKMAHYKSAEINTGAHWAFSVDNVERVLTQIQEALNFKKSQLPEEMQLNFSLRVSIDKYHQAKVKFQWLKNLVDVIHEDQSLPSSRRKFRDISLYFRGILIEDDTVDTLAKTLGGEIGDSDALIRRIQLPDGFVIEVLLKEMRFVGRAEGKEDIKILTFDEYVSEYSDENDDLRLGMTYTKPAFKGRILDSLNIFITHHGRIFPYGGAPDVYGQLGETSYRQFLDRIFADTISRTLLMDGLNFVKQIALEVDPEIEIRIRRKNWVASIADESLATSELRLYVTLRLVQVYLQSGIITKEDLPSYLREIVLMGSDDLIKMYDTLVQSHEERKFVYANEYIGFQPGK